MRLDRGTLVMKEVPPVVADCFQWDARSQSYRARGMDYRFVVEALRKANITFKDEAADFLKLELDFSREIEPYRHQKQALNAWKQAGRRGVVEVPTGGGKTLIAQLALRDTPRSALICVPTLDLMAQWYAGLVAAFPDASIGMLGGQQG